MQGIFLGKRSRNHYHWLVLLSVVLAVVLADFVGWFDPVITVGERVVVPTKVVVTQVIGTALQPVQRLQRSYGAVQKVEELERAYSAALARLTTLEQLEKENEDLRRLLGTVQVQDQEVVIAPVTSYAVPTVGVGAVGGVYPGQRVMFSETFLGQVAAVSEYQSQVSLLKQVGGLAVVAKTESGVEGIVRGDGKNIQLEEVPSTAVLTKGERVTTVGQEGIPEGLFIGVIGNRPGNLQVSAPVQSVVIDQLYTFYDTTIVEIW